MAKSSLPLATRLINCSFSDCSAEVDSRGWCTYHYMRWYKTGNPAPPLSQPTNCSVGNCRLLTHAKGFCKVHYQRWKKYGNPLRDARDRVEYFFSKINFTDNVDDCWEWQGGCFHTGYGVYRYKGQNYIASRLAWELFHDKPAELYILHSCDNPKCCNPNHLREGDAAANSRDAVTRDRVAFGERASGAKLTEGDVAQVFNLLDQGVQQTKIAELMQVNQSTISAIKCGRLWRRTANERNRQSRQNAKRAATSL